jgi:hypothetical protein
MTDFFEKPADNSVKPVDNSVEPAEFQVFKFFLFFHGSTSFRPKFAGFYRIFENSTDSPPSEF